MKKRLSALFLAFVLTLGLTGPAALAAGVHQEVDYAHMVYTGFDDDPIQALFAQLLELDARGALEQEDPDTRRQVEELYAGILQEYDVLLTQYYLIDLRYDADITDAWAAAESADFAQRFDGVTDQCWSALALLADSPYADILVADGGEEAVASLRVYDPMTDEEADLYVREEELVRQYEQVMAQEFSTYYRGKSWTAADLYYDAFLSDDEYWALLTEIEQAENAAAGPIFLELVEVRTRLARLAGYDNYVDYAYEQVYNRDYTPADLEKVCRQVKETLVPLYERIFELAGDDIYLLDELDVSSGEEILAALQPCMDDLDPALGETLAYLRRNHLYDLDDSPTKNATGYTVPLPAYGAAFIFDAPYGNYQDWSSVLHEFGHFYETLHDETSDLWADFNIDVGEIHSQGLEVLFTAYADDLFGPDMGQGFTWNTLLNMVDSVLDGCMYEKFQTQVYRNPHMTLDEMNRLFRTLAEDYGYYTPDDERAYFWVEVNHNFQQPMYYVSYATSALSAIDLYLAALEDRQGAVDTYMELADLGMTLPYRAAVERVGLRDIFDGDTVTRLAGELEDHLDEDYGREPAVREPATQEPATQEPAKGGISYQWLFVAVPILLTLALVLVGLIALVVFLVRRWRRRRAVDPWEAELSQTSCVHGKHKDPWEDDDTLPACKDHKTHDEPWKK